MTFKNLFIEHKRTKEEDAWVKEELDDQEQRFAKIDQQMQDLAPRRAKWYEEFFDRISSRGFNVDGDNKVVIKRENLPVKPDDKEDRVVWKYGVDPES
ncbi:MAG: hypothetical protein ACR2P9_07245 [Gammaproteobacteria bacterium]